MSTINNQQQQQNNVLDSILRAKYGKALQMAPTSNFRLKCLRPMFAFEFYAKFTHSTSILNKPIYSKIFINDSKFEIFEILI